MPHVTIWEEKGIHWSFSGVVTMEEQQQADGEMYNDPRFDEIDYYIWDGSEIESIAYSTRDADEPAAIDKASSTYRPFLKGALIADNQQVKGVVERYIETSTKLKTSWDLRIFSSIVDARGWLNEA